MEAHKEDEEAAQHSEAQHSEAQHSEAQHSEAQHTDTQRQRPRLCPHGLQGPRLRSEKPYEEKDGGPKRRLLLCG